MSIDCWVRLVANSTANYQERCTFGYLAKLSPICFHSIYNSLLSEERERIDPLHSFSTLSTAEQMSFMRGGGGGGGGGVSKAISKSNECMVTSPSLSIFSPINDHLFFLINWNDSGLATLVTCIKRYVEKQTNKSYLRDWCHFKTSCFYIIRRRSHSGLICDGGGALYDIRSYSLKASNSTKARTLKRHLRRRLLFFCYFRQRKAPVQKAPGPDGLTARVIKECSNEISPILALIFNESLARGDVPDEWRQANVSPVFKKVKNMMLLITDRCRSHASAAKP